MVFLNDKVRVCKKCLVKTKNAKNKIIQSEPGYQEEEKLSDSINSMEEENGSGLMENYPDINTIMSQMYIEDTKENILSDEDKIISEVKLQTKKNIDKIIQFILKRYGLYEKW